MGRKIRAGDAKLLSRTARASLKASRKPYYKLIERGVSLGYRKPMAGPGVWLVRRYIGNDTYALKNLLTADGSKIFADDHEDANGATILDFWQAQDALRAKRPMAENGKALGPYTVNQAADDYIAFLTTEGRDESAVRDATTRINAFIRPKLGKFEVSDLSVDQLRKWRAELAKAKPRLRTKKDETQKHREGGDERARKSTANRILTTLKALLNHAFDEEKVSSNKAWGRRVKPFENADASRPGYLTIAEAKRLINTSEPDFRKLVQGALQTGGRYQQIAALRVRDFNPDIGTIELRSRKGRGKEKSYACVLSDEGIQFFKSACAGLAAGDLIFTKANGAPWEKGHQTRLMTEVCKRAGIKPKVGFHQLRHTWASLSVMNGTPLLVVAKNLGHSDTRMVEKNYAHLAPSYIADAIRAGAPKFGIDDKKAKIVSL